VTPIGEFSFIIAQMGTDGGVIPPEATLSKLLRCFLSCACCGSCLSSCWQLLNVPKSWSSRSFRSVSTTIVGFSISIARITRPA
jgi:hypothetical protein